MSTFTANYLECPISFILFFSPVTLMREADSWLATIYMLLNRGGNTQSGHFLSLFFRSSIQKLKQNFSLNLKCYFFPLFLSWRVLCVKGWHISPTMLPSCFFLSIRAFDGWLQGVWQLKETGQGSAMFYCLLSVTCSFLLSTFYWDAHKRCTQAISQHRSGHKLYQLCERLFVFNPWHNVVYPLILPLDSITHKHTHTVSDIISVRKHHPPTFCSLWGWC